MIRPKEEMFKKKLSEIGKLGWHIKKRVVGLKTHYYRTV